MTEAGERMLVDARPSPLELTPHETAVIVVDMQYGFFGAGGAWDRAGVDVSAGQAVLGPLAQVLTAARNAQIPIVYLTMEFTGPPPDQRLWDEQRSARWIAAASGGRPPSEVRGIASTIEDSQILPEIAPRASELVISKPRHSGFYNTDLHARLTQLGISTLVFTGGTTSVCVESTLRDAYFRDYQCLLLADCVAEPIGNRLPRTNHDATLLLVELIYGRVTESAAFLEALTKNAIAADA